MAQGRLTAEEFDERIDAALKAKVASDLDPLFSDLPGPRPGQGVATTQAYETPPWQRQTPDATAVPVPAVLPPRTGGAEALRGITGLLWIVIPLAITFIPWLGWHDYWWLIFIPTIISMVVGKSESDRERERQAHRSASRNAWTGAGAPSGTEVTRQGRPAGSSDARPTVASVSTDRVIRWGIVGPGRIADSVAPTSRTSTGPSWSPSRAARRSGPRRSRTSTASRGRTAGTAGSSATTRSTPSTSRPRTRSTRPSRWLRSRRARRSWSRRRSPPRSPGPNGSSTPPAGSRSSPWRRCGHGSSRSWSRSVS